MKIWWNSIQLVPTLVINLAAGEAVENQREITSGMKFSQY